MSQDTSSAVKVEVTTVDEVPDYIVESQVDRVFRFLDSVGVRLEKDPTVMGPSYVHEKLKECRDYSLEIEGLLVRFYDVERKIKNSLSGYKESYKAEKSELMALDDWVGKGKSSSDREARADMRLKSVVAAISDLREQLVNVQYVLKAIELKKEGLNRTNNDIKKQVSLMEFSKHSNISIDDDYDDLLVQEGRGNKIPLDDDEEVGFLFGDPLPESEPEPDTIPEEAAKHIAPDPEDPIAGAVMGPEEDPNDFLNEMGLDDIVPLNSTTSTDEDGQGDEVGDLDDDMSPDDLADLFNFATVDAKADAESLDEGDSVGDDSDDTDGIDMEAFLDEVD